MTICASTTMTRHTPFGSEVRALSASVPLTLFTANQPMPAVTALSPAGRMLPRNPKGIRDWIICGTPKNGPRVPSSPCESDPSAVPSTIASVACQNVCPNAATASTPTKTVANSRFGEVQVQNSESGRPCRSSSGMNSAPPGSTATTRSPYSPSRILAGIDGVGPVEVATEASSGRGGERSRALYPPPDAPDRCGSFGHVTDWFAFPDGGRRAAPRAREDGGVPEPLEPALARLRPLLADPERLVRAVGAGRRRGAHPSVARAELRPVRLKAGLRLQVTTTDGRTPVPTTRTANHAAGADAQQAVDALLAEPFANWHVETRDGVVQLRVTKSGDAQAHRQAAAGREAVTDHDRARRHLLDPGDPLFGALGADADKRRQVDAFLRQLLAAAGRTIERVRAEGRPLRVVDLGCGNAYLTFAAHRYLAGLLPAGVHPVGVDVRPDLVARNTRLAAELGLAGLTFAVGTIEGADPGGGVDVVLALHACDTATDDALARAVAWRAPVVLAAPCCHHDVAAQLRRSPTPAPYTLLTRSGILRERFADTLTDAMRAAVLRTAGYRVDVIDFVDSKHTPRNTLLRAIRTGASGSEQVRSELDELTRAWSVHPRLAELLSDRLA